MSTQNAVGRKFYVSFTWRPFRWRLADNRENLFSFWLCHESGTKLDFSFPGPEKCVEVSRYLITNEKKLELQFPHLLDSFFLSFVFCVLCTPQSQLKHHSSSGETVRKQKINSDKKNFFLVIDKVSLLSLGAPRKTRFERNITNFVFDM